MLATPKNVVLPRVNRTEEQEESHEALDRFLASLDSDAAQLRAVPPGSAPLLSPDGEVDSDYIATETLVAYEEEPRTGHLLHRVSRGDSWEKLAVAFGVSVQALQRANRMWPSDPIFLRAKLVIPRRKDDVLTWRRQRERERRDQASARLAAEDTFMRRLRCERDVAAHYLRLAEHDVARAVALCEKEFARYKRRYDRAEKRANVEFHVQEPPPFLLRVFAEWLSAPWRGPDEDDLLTEATPIVKSAHYANYGGRGESMAQPLSQSQDELLTRKNDEIFDL